MIKFVKNRVEPILKEEYLKNKSILEIGCVGIGSDDEYGGSNWLHGKLREISDKVIGIDIDKKGLKYLRNKGYNVKYQDAEIPFNLNKKFDVIICSKAFDHVMNLGIFLQNVKNHLSDNGIFILLMPNPHSVSFFTQMLFRGKVGISKKHSHWQDERTLRNILKATGFDIVEISYSHPRPVFNKIKGYLTQFFWIFVPKKMARQFMCISKLRK